jgi:hypothetical protein
VVVLSSRDRCSCTRSRRLHSLCTDSSIARADRPAVFMPSVLSPLWGGEVAQAARHDRGPSDVPATFGDLIGDAWSRRSCPGITGLRSTPLPCFIASAKAAGHRRQRVDVDSPPDRWIKSGLCHILPGAECQTAVASDAEDPPGRRPKVVSEKCGHRASSRPWRNLKASPCQSGQPRPATLSDAGGPRRRWTSRMWPPK